MARTLKLRWASSHYVYGVDDGIRVRFDVECSEGLDARIFAYRMCPVDAGGTIEGFFSHICSPVDMAEYPADQPTAGQSPEWFRLSFVDVFLRSVTEADDFVAVVDGDVRRLCATLVKMETIFPRGTIIVGTDCEPPEGSSDSSDGSTPSSESLGSVSSLVAIGTSEQSVGVGVSWSRIGTGAGSPIGSADSFSANRQRVVLQTGESSKLLLVQGFDFSELPDDSVIVGLMSRVFLRDATDGPAPSDTGSSNSNSDFVSATGPRLSFFVIQHPDLGQSPNRAIDDRIGGPDWETISHGDDGDLWDFASIPTGLLKDGAFSIGVIAYAGDAPAIIEIDGSELEAFYREVI